MTDGKAFGNRFTGYVLGVMALLLVGTVCVRGGVATFVYTGPSVTIPEKSWVEVPLEVSGAGQIVFNSITNLSISLTITGGRNDDTIVRLRAPGENAPYIYLINRPSVGYRKNEAGGNYNHDYGFVVTISDAGVGDIHLYRLYDPQFDDRGRLLGTWQPDGRDVPPGSGGDVYKSATRYSLAEIFNGINPVGTWYLELADWGQDSQNRAVLEGWALEITAVPEPVHVALVVWVVTLGVAYTVKILLKTVFRISLAGPTVKSTGFDAGR